MRIVIGLCLKVTFLSWVFIVAVATGCTAKPPKHGTSILVAVETNHLNTAQECEQLLAYTAEVLRKRMAQLGIRTFVQQTNGDKIVVILPRLKEAELTRARRLIENAGVLELRMVHPDSDVYTADGMVAPGYEILREERKQPGGAKTFVSFLVNRKAERGLTGKYIKRAMVTRDLITNKPQINFELDSEGAKLFAEVTREYSPKGNKFHQLAIVVNGVLYSAPRIVGPIEEGRAVINGNFDLQEAAELASTLENPLKAPVRVLEVRGF